MQQPILCNVLQMLPLLALVHTTTTNKKYMRTLNVPQAHNPPQSNNNNHSSRTAHPTLSPSFTVVLQRINDGIILRRQRGHNALHVRSRAVSQPHHVLVKHALLKRGHWRQRQRRPTFARAPGHRPHATTAAAATTTEGAATSSGQRRVRKLFEASQSPRRRIDVGCVA